MPGGRCDGSAPRRATWRGSQGGYSEVILQIRLLRDRVKVLLDILSFNAIRPDSAEFTSQRQTDLNKPEVDSDSLRNGLES